MKVGGPGRVNTPSPIKKRQKSQASGGKFTVSGYQPEVAAPVSVGGTGPIAAIDSLLALQEVDEEGRGRALALQRGHDILDKLDEIRHALLLGTISRERLEAIARLIQTERKHFDDPRLTEIMDDIELRAEVELAKLRYCK